MFETYSPQLLRDAIEFEMQKTDDPKQAAITALARLKKDPKYYESFGLFDQMQKARTHKYLWKKPDGKGGWLYGYKEDVNRQSVKPEEKKEKPKDQTETAGIPIKTLKLETKEKYIKYITESGYIDVARKFKTEKINDEKTGMDVLRSAQKYQNFWYKDVNKDLREVEDYDDLHPEVKKIMNDMDILIDKFKIKDNIKMYRGIAINEELKNGDVFEHKSFASFTSNPFEATQHGFEAIIECDFKKGDAVAPMIFYDTINYSSTKDDGSRYTEDELVRANILEQEFVARHGIKFRVLSKQKKSGIDYYRMEVYHG